MLLNKSVLLFAALVGSAVAAATTSSLNSSITSTTSIGVSSGCTLSSFTASQQSQLDSLSGCEAVKGDLYIAGNIGSAAIANVKVIYGNLIVKNATNLASLTADSLTTITEQLSLSELTILSTLSFASLSSVGSVNFVTLPALEEIVLTTGISDTESVYISDTELSSLEGFVATNVDTFNVNNNLNLNSINSSLQTVTTALEVSFNSDSLDVSFDDLVWANNITFRDISSVSLDKLEAVNSSLGFISNSLEKVTVKNLKTVGGTFVVSNNDELTNLSFPDLTAVSGGFIIANNSKLKDLDGFASLKTVGGAFQLIGNFSNATFDSLSQVKGAFDVETKGDLDCDTFNSFDAAGKVGGKYVCSAASSSTSAAASSTSSGSGSSSSSASGSASGSASSSSKSKGAANAVSLESASLLSSLAALLLALL